MNVAQKNALFSIFNEFSVVKLGENSTEISVKSYGTVPKGMDLDEGVEDLGLGQIVTYLPVDQSLCYIDDLMQFRALGTIKTLAVETDQMSESSELHQSDGFELLRNVENLKIVMRRPKDGIKQLDGLSFVEALLAYVNPDIELNFVLFDLRSKGPKTRSKRLHGTARADIDIVNDVFLGFKNYRGCSHQRRFPSFL